MYHVACGMRQVTFVYHGRPRSHMSNLLTHVCYLLCNRSSLCRATIVLSSSSSAMHALALLFSWQQIDISALLHAAVASVNVNKQMRERPVFTQFLWFSHLFSNIMDMCVQVCASVCVLRLCMCVFVTRLHCSWYADLRLYVFTLLYTYLQFGSHTISVLSSID